MSGVHLFVTSQGKVHTSSAIEALCISWRKEINTDFNGGILVRAEEEKNTVCFYERKKKMFMESRCLLV